MKHAEYHQQRSFIQWVSRAKLETATLPDLDMIYAIPNGANLTERTTAKGRKVSAASQGAKLKKEGARAGVPDLCLPVPREPFHGLYLEFKRPPGDGKPAGKPSPKQKEYMQRLDRLGYKVEVVYLWSDARDAVLKYYGVKL
jgi:hypothetical protein